MVWRKQFCGIRCKNWFVFSEECREEDMINEITGNVAAGIEDEDSWSPEYGKIYFDRAEAVDGFRSLIEEIGSRFLPEK